MPRAPAQSVTGFGILHSMLRSGGGIKRLPMAFACVGNLLARDAGEGSGCGWSRGETTGGGILDIRMGGRALRAAEKLCSLEDPVNLEGGFGQGSSELLACAARNDGSPVCATHSRGGLPHPLPGPFLRFLANRGRG